MLGGGLLSFWVLVPAIQLFAPELTSPLIGGGALPVRDMTPGQIRSAYLLYIGAGAVAAGGLLSLLRALPSLWAAFRGAARSFSLAGGGAGLRTERDLPISLVLGGALALLLAIPLAPGLGLGFPSALLVLLFGFFFVTVSSRITGQIGSSSNPISGMTVATLLATCLLFAAVGWTGVPYKEMALATAALVCVAASNGGTISQDLKTGFLVGATPRAQQIAIAVGVVTSALVIGATLLYLNEAATTYRAAQPSGVRRERGGGRGAGRERSRAARLRLASAASWRGASWRVLYVRQPTDGVPTGKYLVGDDDRIAWLVDPGVCGLEPEQRAAGRARREGGLEVRRAEGAALPADHRRRARPQPALGAGADRCRDRADDGAVRRAVAAVRGGRLSAALDLDLDRARRLRAPSRGSTRGAQRRRGRVLRRACCSRRG